MYTSSAWLELTLALAAYLGLTLHVADVKEYNSYRR